MIKQITIVLSIFFMKTLLSCGPGECVYDEVQEYRLNDFQLSTFVLNTNGLLDPYETPAQVDDLRILIFPELILEDDSVVANMGCIPPLANFLDPDYITDFSITSNQDYYSYKAGENLTDIFKYVYSNESEEYSSSGFVRARFSTRGGNGFIFLIIIPPNIQSDHEFTFSFTLEDGRELSKTTQSLTILP